MLFPQIDPVILNIAGPFAIRWYSLAYIAGILLGHYYLKFISKNFFELSNKAQDEIITYSILGIILGGRLGYVLFYDFKKYLSEPLRILATWEGGMSFHGGILGFTIAVYVFTVRHKIDLLRLADLLSCVAPIGICFGRIANFINAELYGKVTNMPWGVIFPGELFARHPSQLYEAFSEGIVCFIMLSILFFKTKIKERRGGLLGCFLIIYSISRIIVEMYREPDAHIGYVIDNITTGQILSFPMLILGIIFIIKAFKNGYKLPN
ncbi:MAG: prolipoprotein diacylglyceryl transferase [Alphaproteobacteria bacterium]